MKFIPALKEDSLKTTGKLYFIFNGDKLFIEKKDGAVYIPAFNISEKTGLKESDLVFIGYIDSTACYTGIQMSVEKNADTKDYAHLMYLSGNIVDSHFVAGCFAFHLAKWNNNSRYCGICGCSTSFMDEERAKKCSS